MGVSKECRVGWAVASLQAWLSEQPQIALSAAIFSDLVSAAPAPGKIRGGTWALQGCGAGLYQSAAVLWWGRYVTAQGRLQHMAPPPKNQAQHDLPPKGWVRIHAWHLCWKLSFYSGKWHTREVFSGNVFGLCWTLTLYPARTCWGVQSASIAAATKNSSAPELLGFIVGRAVMECCLKCRGGWDLQLTTAPHMLGLLFWGEKLKSRPDGPHKSRSHWIKVEPSDNLRGSVTLRKNYFR